MLLLSFLSSLGAEAFETPPEDLPAPWASVDIGTVGQAGSASVSGGVFSISGAGADIWGAADSFHFVWQPLTGDGEIIARVTGIQNTHTYAKAGVMLRGSLAPGAPHVILDVKPGGGLEFMTRTATGGSTSFLGGAAQGVPVWLRLARSGSVVIGSWSTNGTIWTEVGRTTIPLPGTAYAGLPVVSHDTSVLNTATFDNVSVSAETFDTPPAVPGNPAPADGAMNVSAATALSWSPSPGATHYDVRFGTSSTPPLVASNQTGNSYQPPALQYGQVYFWQVTAHGSGGSTPGPVWSFTTEAAPPPPPPPSTALRRLRVLTWNVNGGRDRTGTANVDAQVSLMARSGAHVIVLQEVTIESGADLRALYQSKLSEATASTWNALWIEEPRVAPAVTRGNLILSRLPLGATDAISLDTAPSDANQLDAKRSAGRAIVVVNGRVVTIAATALSLDPVSRQAQIDALQSWMSMASGPRLLGGSFAMRPDDEGYADLATTLADVWPTLVTTNDTGVTAERFGSAAQPARVDGWWQDLPGTAAAATEVWIIKTARSTHHAVVAEVDVR